MFHSVSYVCLLACAATRFEPGWHVVMLVVGCQAAHIVPPQRFTVAQLVRVASQGEIAIEGEDREVRLTQKLFRNIQTGLKPTSIPFSHSEEPSQPPRANHVNPHGTRRLWRVS
jgi:hypothetical protein